MLGSSCKSKLPKSIRDAGYIVAYVRSERMYTLRSPSGRWLDDDESLAAIIAYAKHHLKERKAGRQCGPKVKAKPAETALVLAQPEPVFVQAQPPPAPEPKPIAQPTPKPVPFAKMRTARPQKPLGPVPPPSRPDTPLPMVRALQEAVDWLFKSEPPPSRRPTKPLDELVGPVIPYEGRAELVIQVLRGLLRGWPAEDMASQYFQMDQIRHVIERYGAHVENLKQLYPWEQQEYFQLLQTRLGGVDRERKNKMVGGTAARAEA